MTELYIRNERTNRQRFCYAAWIKCWYNIWNVILRISRKVTMYIVDGKLTSLGALSQSSPCGWPAPPAHDHLTLHNYDNILIQECKLRLRWLTAAVQRRLLLILFKGLFGNVILSPKNIGFQSISPRRREATRGSKGMKTIHCSLLTGFFFKETYF